MMPVRAILFLLLAGLIWQCNPGENSPEQLPNIILCMADDQGWGDMGYTGHPVIRTPHFDAMASEAIRFDHFYAAAPVCSPTRGSVMTGRHPNRFACFTWGRTIRPQEITIAEVLKEAGYVTGHFGKWHLGPVRTGSPFNPGENGFDRWFSAPNFFDNDPILSREGIAVKTKGESSMVIVEAAMDFIREQENSHRPYLAVIWFGSPHRPHRAIKEDREAYEGLDERLSNFYGEISGMDRAFGKLRSFLETLDSYDNTLLWYCSDNGGLPDVGTTGGRGHKGNIYEGGLRVPALLQWPARFKEHAIVKDPANTSDIFPTLLNITGIKSDPERPLDGISLLPVLNGKTETLHRTMGFWSYPAKGVPVPSATWMEELWEAQQHGNMVGDSARLRLQDPDMPSYPSDSLPGHAAWLDWPWKLHRIAGNGGTVEWELYNLDRDTMERINLVEKFPEMVSRMQQQLEAWQYSVVHSMNGADY